MERGDLEKLSKEELVEVCLALQSRLQRPAKTSKTSSKPPSTDRKARRDHAKPGGPKKGHKGHSRKLCEDPNEIVDHRPDTCPNCQNHLAEDLVADVLGEYDEIELPPITPYVTRHRRLGVCCPNCSKRVKAPLPQAATGSPFGPRLHALALYLKTFHLASYSRLQQMFGDLFSLNISQGALVNMLVRSHAPFAQRKADIINDLRRANSVASDETGIRIEGINAWHWIFMSSTAVVHEAQPSRGAKVVRDVMGDHRPKLWLSDGYVAQQKHGHYHQTCLAHLLRDVEYGVAASDDMAPVRLKWWFADVFDLARNMATLAASTVKTKVRQLKTRLNDIVESRPDCAIAAKLVAKIERASPKMLTFVDFQGEVDVTNNACERGLRPAVIQRKVTNGFRSMWAAKGDCAVRTVVDTERISGHSPFQTIYTTLA